MQAHRNGGASTAPVARRHGQSEYDRGVVLDGRSKAEEKVIILE